MKLPPMPDLPTEWSSGIQGQWSRLIERSERFKQAGESGDAFNKMCARIRSWIARGDAGSLYRAHSDRLAARALTWLWVNDPEVLKRSFHLIVLQTLVEKQTPRLTRLTLLQLCQLYFDQFDQLDTLGRGLSEALADIIHEQIRKIPLRQSNTTSVDPIYSLQQNHEWLIGPEGPAKLANEVRDKGEELETRFSELGLVGYDTGRYGDLCRAHYYIESLKSVPIGHWSPIFDELLKPSVSRAPFGDGRRIGHAALETLIDRADSAEISEDWQKFIIGVAGDPRIHSGSRNYQEWWRPLGEQRIEKVRGWLSKEDLNLFLRALEQYGIESNKADLRRMFPARKKFLEGLYKQGLIRSTRLMLGRQAEGIVKRLLGDEIKTNFAALAGSLADKAVIYLDCGDFYLVEGSHSFKIWVYLAKPGTMVWSYEFNAFSHGDLTHVTPNQYEAMYGLPYEAVTHNGTWQAKVINFLADHGIELDVESVLTPKEYKTHLARFGMPVVKTPKTRVPEPKALPNHLRVRPSRSPKPSTTTHDRFGNPITQTSTKNSAKERFLRGRLSNSSPVNRPQAMSDTDSATQMRGLTHLQRSALQCLAANPGIQARYVASLLNIPLRELVTMLVGPLSPYVIKKDMTTWRIKPEWAETFQ